MVIDIDLYKANKALVQGLFKEGTDVANHISMMATSFGIPVIVVTYWMGEVVGWTPAIVEKIDRIRDFYGYTQILNKPEGAPV